MHGETLKIHIHSFVKIMFICIFPALSNQAWSTTWISYN